ncbi:MAG: hypothetical protein EOL87_01050 [Spartobacteria bacterium]|nr:hypothetical protein [Spartobacteria bacterium]
MQNVCWNQISLDIPDEWEMLQFSRSDVSGRCAFADRYRFRLEVDWKEVGGEPDFDRMMSDYQHRLTDRGGLKDAVNVKGGAGFHGLCGMQNGIMVSRFGIYLEQPGILVELVFLWPDQRDVRLENTILFSVQFNAADGQGMITRRAWGLNVRVPRRFPMTECLIQPALARYTYGKKNNFWQIERLGMVDTWLTVPLEDWAVNRLDKQCVHGELSTRTAGGHKIWDMSGDFVRKGLAHPNGTYQSMCWRCPVDQRIYRFLVVRPTGKPACEKAPFDYVSCCQPFGGIK